MSTAMPEWLRQRAHLTPERPALRGTTGDLSFRDLDIAVEALALKLRNLRVKQDSMVGILSANSVEFVKAVHAVARLGAVLLPLNTRLTPVELTYQLRDAGAHLLLHDAGSSLLASAVSREIDGLVTISLEKLAKLRQPAGRTAPRQFDLDELLTVMYTAGTTGRPKGVMLTAGNHFWSATASVFNLGYQTDDRWLVCLPLFHVGGLSTLFKSVLYGMPVVLHENFEPAQVNRSIDSDRVTIVSVVASMLQRMLEERGSEPYPKSLRCVLLGGGPAPLPLLERCAERGVPVVQTYGLTETASQVVTLAPEDALVMLGSAGKPLLPVELKIGGQDGKASGVAEEGEILVRGPMVMSGYLGRPEESERALIDGWLHTGDLGYLDPEGYLYVLDRRDDLIVSGGENVYPAEVEAALQSHPNVLEAGVFGIEDERWGQVPAAVVVLRDGVTVTESELIEFCATVLARYKVPSMISLASSLPRGASGKLLRYVLRAQYQADAMAGGG